MKKHGYKIVMLRDCTTGLHTKETLPGLMADKVWLEYAEKDVDYTSTAGDFIKACKNA